MSKFANDLGLTKSQMDEALEEHQRTGEMLGSILIRRGWITEEQLQIHLARSIGYEYVAAHDATVVSESACLISAEEMRRWRVAQLVPQDPDGIAFVTSRLNDDLIWFLRDRVGDEFDLLFTTHDGLRELLRRASPDAPP